MKLYHFTANRFLESIQTEGLTRGTFPVMMNDGIGLIPDIQWLTKSDSFDQPWHDPEFTQLPYDRRENRLTISIPKSHDHSLYDWPDIRKHYGQFFIQDFDFHEDRNNWFIYLGRIKPSWIKEVVNRDTIMISGG